MPPPAPAPRPTASPGPEEVPIVQLPHTDEMIAPRGAKGYSTLRRFDPIVEPPRWKGELKNCGKFENQQTMERRFHSDVQEAKVKNDIFNWLQRAKDSGHMD